MSDAPEGAVVALPVAGDQSASSASFWLCAATLWRRELRGFYRQRSRVVGTLSTPLLFWLVLGSGFGSSLLAAEGGYAQFFFPGMLALSVLFTSIFANISLIEDRREGFLLGVLVAPVSRLALVLGKVCGATTLGAKLPLVFAALLLMAFGVTCLGFFCAWWLNSVQGFHSIMNLVLMPMWLVSGGVFPSDGSSAWLRWLTAVNPLTYGVAELRRLLDAPGSGAVPAPELSWLVLAGFGAVMLLAAWRKAVRSEAAHLS